MRPTVYIETSVVSYLTAQVSRDLVVAAHQELTIEWWDKALPKFEPFVSPVVLERSPGVTQTQQRSVYKL